MNRFLKIHPNIQTVMNSDELAIYIALLEQDYLINNGSTKGWGKDFMMRASGTTRRKFDSATQSMVQKGILTIENQNISGKKNKYLLKQDHIVRIIEILDETNNKPVLTDFFKNLFKNKKTALDITQDDIEYIKNSRIVWKTINGKSVRDRTQNKMYSLSDEKDKSQYIDESEYKKPVQTEHTAQNAQNNDLLKDFSEMLSSQLESMQNMMLKVIKSQNDKIDELQKRVQNVPALPKSQYTTYTSIYRKNRMLMKNCVFFLFEKKKQKYIGGLLSAFVTKTDLKRDFLSGKIRYKRNVVLASSNKKNKAVVVLGGNNIKPKETIIDIDIPDNKKEQINNTPDKQKLDMIYQDENKRFISPVINYFSERYPEGSCENKDVAIAFFEELKEEYLSFSPELMRISFSDLFRHFIYKDDKVFTFYNKVSKNEIELSNSEIELFKELSNNTSPSLKLNSDDETKIIGLAHSSLNIKFSEGDAISLQDANKVVSDVLLEFGAPMIQSIKWNNERIAPMLLGDIIRPIDPYDHEYWEIIPIAEKANQPNQVDFKESTKKIIKEHIKKADVISETKDLNFSDITNDEDNIFISVLEDYRITRRMDTSDVKAMVQNMSLFVGFENESNVLGGDLKDLIVAISRKIELSPEETWNKGGSELFKATQNEMYQLIL